MNILTHIVLSQIIYDNLIIQTPLDKFAFIYGNMKPDLNHKLLENSHIADNYLIYVCNHSAQLMKEEIPIKEFSTELGQICHYVCDFFCRYHLNKEIFHHYREHFFYECKLHFALRKINRQFNRLNNQKVNRNVASIIFHMKNKYLTDSCSINKDIDYAISTSIWICKSVSYFLCESIKQSEEKQDAKAVLSLVGGQSYFPFQC